MSNKNKKNLTIQKKEQKGKRSYRIGRKIPLSLLLALTLPLTICFFGPFETYCGNIAEFTFSLGDFLPLCAIAAVLAAAFVFAVLLLLDGIAYDIAAAIVTWLSVMAFAQRYYLNLGINALVGDGVGVTEVNPISIVINTAIWVAVGAAAVALVIFAKKKNIAPYFVSCAILLIAILITQTVGFASLSFNTDAYIPVTDRTESDGGDEEISKDKVMLTYDNLNELSKGNNVIFFVIDRFDVRYFERLQKNDPSFLEGLDGFTFYNDYLSLYCRTYPAIASMLTGKENDFEKTRTKFFKEIYEDGGHMRAMHDAGYDVNVYTEQYYGYDDARYMSDYVKNLSNVKGYKIDSHKALSQDMLRLSLNTCLPFVAKDIVGELSTPDFNSHAVYDTDAPVYDASDMKDVYEYITKEDFSTVKSHGQFSFIHIYGCHTPVKYNLNWEEANDKEKNDTTMALKQSLTIIYEYIAEMKRLGLYDDATIIITGDHPAALSDTKLIGETGRSDDNGTRVTTMLFKRSGDSGTAMKTSTAQISQDELWNTIYESEGLTELKTGESFFDIAEGEERVRRYLFEWAVYLENDQRADEIVEYRITGSARQRENWEIAKRTVVGRIYK